MVQAYCILLYKGRFLVILALLDEDGEAGIAVEAFGREDAEVELLRSGLGGVLIEVGVIEFLSLDRVRRLVFLPLPQKLALPSLPDFLQRHFLDAVLRFPLLLLSEPVEHVWECIRVREVVGLFKEPELVLRVAQRADVLNVDVRGHRRLALV